MIALIVGTTAELIKMAPVFHELAARGRLAEIWYTGQHVDELSPTSRDLDLPEPAVWLVPRGTARNLARPAEVPAWLVRVVRTTWARRAELRRRLTVDGTPAVVLVHGDTFTAPLGALIGRRLGARIGHVEAGMRSGSLLHPFPEELNRRAVAHLTDIHFAPTEREEHNLRRRRGVVVVTGANTVVDAVRYALERPEEEDARSFPEGYGVATLHRFELVRDESLYRDALECLADYARRRHPIVYFAGRSELERLGSYGLLSLFDEERFVLAEKLSYVRFLPVLAKARFVVTDSGGLQEESAHLGIPCAVHRRHTERMDGVGVSMVLTGLDRDALSQFLEGHERHRSAGTVGDVRPSALIVDAIEALGGGAAARVGG
ncbi:UDP-N-acetylglucosamine 2-epimerase [Actinotalea fermentans]|uniref:UDP-N-acetyl glucosamine 2-epimerase n=1 Tax=Actinotalea fermentans TaxID=43671 RepID=A0A511YSX8_9CELL|nr:UDP-N-acetylglucosamine 2-epimerase [Actinotalea fermentans]KGM16670.1 UDP-N-acetylglucosamine 2-epimerase [Actinotalea fermentans ATCC 43279 = JCM 9966 = DSM 3133]GEN78276.1 UDP-N-acetyl glucosamine 2-epimerase [Actinotalea fermentans]